MVTHNFSEGARLLTAAGSIRETARTLGVSDRAAAVAEAMRRKLLD